MKLTSLFLCGVLALVCSTATAGYWRADLLKQSVPNIRLHKLGTYESGLIDESAAEIVAYDKRSQRLFVTNAKDQSVDVLSIRNPRKPYKLFALDLTPYGEPNSVAVSKGIVAVAAAADEVDVTGKVVFFNRNGKFLNSLEVGFLPDMLTFSPDGAKLVCLLYTSPSPRDS